MLMKPEEINEKARDAIHHSAQLNEESNPIMSDGYIFTATYELLDFTV